MIYVNGHFRRLPATQQPRWIVLRWDGTTWLALARRGQWTTNLDKAELQFKRTVNKRFEEELEHGLVETYKVT